MQLSLTFNALLAGLLIALSVTGDVEASPTKRGSGMVTMPLRSLHNMRDSTVHPQILLQQHMNRGNRRLARMTGQPSPSPHEMRATLQRRIDHVHIGYAMGNHTHAKRYVIKDKSHGKRQDEYTPPELGGTEPNDGYAATPNAQSQVGTDAQSQVGTDGPSKRQVSGSDSSPPSNPDSNTFSPDDSDSSPPANPNTITQSTSPDPNSDSSGPSSVDTQGTSSTNQQNIGPAKSHHAHKAHKVSRQASNSTAEGVSPLDIAAAANGGLTLANAPTDSNSIGLDIEADDVGYVGSVQIGTPPREFLQLMDSGSADFWVGAENCQSTGGGGCGNHTFLGADSSSTFVDTGKPFAVSYGTGNVAGDIIQDNVNIAGLTLTNHTFGVATNESVQFSADTIPFDGLIGLAQSILSEQQTLTPVESLAQTGQIQDAITSFKIPRLADNLNDGEVTFGGLDSSKFDANTLVTFDNVNTQGFWEGPMVPTVNGQSVGLDTGRTAILDTGTTLIVAPPSDATAVHGAISGAKSDGQGGFTVPCTLNDTVTLSFAGSQFNIDPRDMAVLPVNVNDPTGDCVSGISSGTIDGPTQWLVGDVFLKNAYFSVDVGKNAISLAQLV